MKGEDIYNGITDIRDDLIEKAGRKKNKGRVWRGAVAAAFLAASEGTNSVCSPANVYMALSMLCEITDGSTRGQVMELLGAGSIEEVRERANRLWNAIYNDDGTSKLLLANSMWLRDDMSYNEETITRLAEDHYASSFAGQMGGAALNQLLRDWLNAQTGELLRDQIEEIELDPRTAIAFASTVYFSDRWAWRFSADETTSEIFHSPDGDGSRDFMHLNDMWGTYYWSDHFSGTSLPFETAGTMLLLLPDEGVSIEEILHDPEAMAFLTGTGDWNDENSERLLIDLSLPKFDVVSDTDLKGALEALGVTEAFDETRADFTPLTPDADGMYVSKILHGARVLIDEEGCEAAAYTVMPASGNGAPPEDRVELIFDRPFLFSIIVEGVPMFVGIVNQP